MKKIFLVLLILILSKVYAMDKIVNLELRNVRELSGKIYLAIYNSEITYKEEKPFKSYILESSSSIICITEKLPEGYYLVSGFQDLNGNGKLDFTFIGIPKEPIGLSNYNGMGIPGGFEKMKIKVTEDNQTIIIKMIKII